MNLIDLVTNFSLSWYFYKSYGGKRNLNKFAKIWLKEKQNKYTEQRATKTINAIISKKSPGKALLVGYEHLKGV